MVKAEIIEVLMTELIKKPASDSCAGAYHEVAVARRRSTLYFINEYVLHTVRHSGAIAKL